MTLTKYSETDAVAYGGPRRFLHMGDLGLELFSDSDQKYSETDAVAYGGHGRFLHMGGTGKLL